MRFLILSKCLGIPRPSLIPDPCLAPKIIMGSLGMAIRRRPGSSGCHIFYMKAGLQKNNGFPFIRSPSFMSPALNTRKDVNNLNEKICFSRHFLFWSSMLPVGPVGCCFFAIAFFLHKLHWEVTVALIKHILSMSPLLYSLAVHPGRNYNSMSHKQDFKLS